MTNDTLNGIVESKNSLIYLHGVQGILDGQQGGLESGISKALDKAKKHPA